MSFADTAIFVMAALLVLACESSIEREPRAGGAGGAGGHPVDMTCPDIAETWTMILVPKPDGSSFCIDSREVTNEQYASFLGSGPVPELHRACEPSEHVPRDDWPPPPGRERYPVGWVTWCDAYAFCAVRGKRLCGDADGKVQELTLPYSKEEAAGNAETEMWLACSHGGARAYAYGNEPVPGVCNDAGFETLPADGGAACEGGYPGIFYLQGNALEWEGACKLNTSDEGLSGPYCVARGIGSCAGDSVETPEGTGPDVASATLGFRCCADSIPVK